MTNGTFPVPSETVESGLLHACTTMEQWLELATFTEDDFTTHREVYRFFKSHLLQYNSLPTQSQIGTRFSWAPPVGEFHYWLEEMKRYSLARQVLAVIQDGYENIKDPQKSLGEMLTKLSLIRSRQSNHIQATDAAASDRLERFDNRTENIFNSNSILGIRTGMKVYDKSLIGWIPGSLVGCYARPGLGKTWWLLWEGLQAWLDGHTVLAITPEMPANMLNLRVDILVANALGHTIEYNKLLKGDPSIRKEYELVTDVMAQTSRWWTYDSLEGQTIGLGDISALVRQHSPDIVLIDGISLLRREGRGQVWEGMLDTCYGLKNLATISEVPIIVTHQAVNSNRGRRTDDTGTIPGRGDDFHMPSLNDAAFGDAFVQACSDVITMCAEPTSQHINWYSLRKYRERGFEKLETRYALAVDFGFGKIYDLSELGYSPALVGEHTRRLLGVI